MFRGVRRLKRHVSARRARAGARSAAARPREIISPFEHKSGEVGRAVVLRRAARTVQVRVLATGEQITVRARDLWHVMPGHVVTLTLEQRWQYRDHLYAVGEVSEAHIDAPALGLPPLRVDEHGPLDTSGVPAEAGQEAAVEPEALQQLRAQIQATERAAYEIEQVLPRAVAWTGADPILIAIARRKRGDATGAVRLLMELLAEDLRCLDAHAHLGNFVFPTYPEHALIHYEIGVAIGDHALGSAFAGALPWSFLNNRPFLRCLHGQGLALWRLERLEEAARVFERLLWLNPDDDQGVGRCWAEVKAGRPWLEGGEGCCA